MLSLVVAVPAPDAELAADLLWELGVLAVEERDPDGGDTDDHFVELWTSLGDDLDHIARAAEAFPARWRWRVVEIDDDVVNTWREHARPTWIDDSVVIVPAWRDDEVVVPEGGLILRIEPADTFGMGDHPTTVLSARALLASVFPGASVLDVGCGSGVLAVLAARAGAGRVEAVDIHPSAVGVTEANARANGVGGVVHASLALLAAFAEPFDIVVANILAPALVELAPELVRLVAPAGVLVISGILMERHEHVLAALTPLVVAERHERDGWVAVTLRR